MKKKRRRNMEKSERQHATRSDQASPPDLPTFASPPCFMHEFDLPQQEQIEREELLVLLNQLLEAERAGAREIEELSKRTGGPETESTLHAIATDEAHCCEMLIAQIKRLNGTPSRWSGSRLLEEGDLTVQHRGHGWVVRKLRDALPRIADQSLRADLEEMLEIHERNMRRISSPAPHRVLDEKEH